MNRETLDTELPEPVRRYFEEVAHMEPSTDLMDGVITEIEMQGAVNRFSSVPVFAALAAAGVLIAAVVAGAGLIGRDQSGNVPLASASQTASPSLDPGALVPDELQARFYGTDPSESGSITFTATTFRYIDEHGQTLYRSDAALIGPDAIRLIATHTADCDSGNGIGIYRFSLSPDGRRLTLAAAGNDSCGSRSFRTAGYWERRD